MARVLSIALSATTSWLYVTPSLPEVSLRATDDTHVSMRTSVRSMSSSEGRMSCGHGPISPLRVRRDCRRTHDGGVWPRVTHREMDSSIAADESWIAVDSAGGVHITYSDDTNLRSRCAFQPACRPAKGGTRSGVGLEGVALVCREATVRGAMGCARGAVGMSERPILRNWS